MNLLFDTHAHINTKPFIDDIEATIKEARENGIAKIGCVGYDKEANLKAIELAQQFPGIVYAIIGLHPAELNGLTHQDYEAYVAMLDQPGVVAVGEIGLDYYWDNIDREIQKDYFRRQIHIAKEKNLPIVIHNRDATQDTYDILKEEGLDHIDCIMHSYSGSVEMAREFIKLGCYISISGVVTFKNAKSVKEVVKEVDMDKLLIETDCPYLTPVPFRGQTNYPQYTYYVAKEIALIKGISEEEVIKQTYINGCKVFKIKEEAADE